MASRVLAAERGPRAIARLSRRAFVQRSAALGAATLLGSCGVGALAPSSSTRVRRIGYLSTAHYAEDPTQWNPSFRKALRDLGYVEGRDIRFELRLAEGVLERLPALAAELVDLRVDVLVTSGGAVSAIAAKRATSTIPIVFNGLEDPVGLGIVADLARPGGNVTGVPNPAAGLAVKRLELLREAVPGLARVVLFLGPDPSQIAHARATEDAARTLGVDIHVISVDALDRLHDALQAAARQRPQGLIDSHGSQFYGRDLRELINDLRPDAGLGKLLDFAVRNRLPQIYNGAEFARAGGLMGLGPNGEARWRATAEMVDEILRGANPADLPVRVTSVFDLALNLTMAQRIGLTFPESVLRQATEVIQ